MEGEGGKEREAGNSRSCFDPTNVLGSMSAIWGSQRPSPPPSPPFISLPPSSLYLSLSILLSQWSVEPHRSQPLGR